MMQEIKQEEPVVAQILDFPEALDSPEDISKDILSLVERWREHKSQVYMAGVGGAPDWLEYEHWVWQLGEALRFLFKKKKGWHGKSKLLDTCAEILTDDSYGKGRQTFALLLGDFGKGNYGSSLGAMLNDSEVQGHCIKALAKAGIKGFADEIHAIENASHGWIRKAASGYLKKVDQVE
jgi:hypothetical protein